ncbi:FHA domain-containing protein [Tolypothrix sp. FACHB-123]|uniref:FHA domain-containing protein n=1 Tax=Tolypothrix sp. FACHB-123 TaxID=2692868 RepID=UPI001689F424|nr:FHA domain-containing protein [Tolypothrix sp. FACHB-123]MBD2354946.1 FHA domain-containing protein [Tolypothrix sp. FACHB-123]
MKIKVNYSPTLNEVNELDLALATTPKGECIIGRSPDSDVVLDSPDVSRVHGKFFIQSGNYYFCDLGSRNGSIINGKIAEKNRPFLLKDKDIIRIGDYMMIVEDIIPVSEQLAETVFRTIDPAIFSGRLSNDSVSNLPNQTPEVVSEVPQQLSSESAPELSQLQSEVEASELEEAINALESILETPEETGEQQADVATPIVEQATFIQPQDVITPTPEAVSEVTPTINEEIVATPTSEEVTLIQPEDVITPTAEEVTLIQPEDIITPTPEVVNETPSVINEEIVATPTSEEVPFIQTLEAVNETPSVINEEIVATPTSEEVTLIQPENVITPTAEAVSETSSVINEEIVATSTSEEIPFIQPEDVITSTAEAVSETSSVINEEIVATPTSEEVSVNEIPGDINEQDIDWDAEIPREFTIVQPRDIVIQPSQMVNEIPTDISEENIAANEESLQELTNVQPRDILSQTPELISKVPADVAEILQDFTIIQPRNVNLPFESVSEPSESISNEDDVDEIKVDIAPVEAPEFVDNFTPEFSHDDEDTFTEDVLIVSGYVVSAPPDMLSEDTDISVDDTAIVETPPVPEISNQEVDVSAENTEEISPDIGDLETAQDMEVLYSTVNEVEELTNIESLEKSEELAAISNSETEELEDEIMPELVSNQNSEAISQRLEAIFGTEKTLSDEIAEQVPVSEPQPMIDQKNIVLIAHDSKKSELADFVNKHKDFFSQSLTVAWPSISEVLNQEAGVTVSQQIPAATSGGYQTINSLVNSGEVLAVIFLRDFLVPQPGQANEEAFLRSCNINQVLLATNLPTAEAIVHYLKHL